MPSPERKKPSSSCGFRRKFLEQWNRFRRSAPKPPGNTNNDSQSQMLQDGEPFGVCVSRIEHTTTTASLHSTSKAHEAPEKGISIDDTVLYHDHKCALSVTLHTTDSEDSYSTEQATTLVDGVASDLWSTAYREAVESLGEDINVAIVKGKRLEQLFRELEEIDKEVSTKSAFLRGLEHLKAIQGPLGTLKQVLDVATPLASAEPTAATVFGVVSGVTTIAISLASADMEFAKKIREMLEQLPCIDDCDTLGQKADNKNIHQALVLVYQKILEFYQASFDILTKKGVKLVAKIVLANNNLAGIIEDFLVCASNLRNLISVATSEVIQDMSDMLYDQEISRWLGSERATVQSQYYQSLKQHRADQACEFLLADARFDNWYRTANQQQLVIVGDMGSGKSVLMTFLVEELKQRSERQLPQPKVCHYYCRADGTGTIVCILSTLILELLKQFPGLKKPFFNWYKEAEVSGDFDPATNIHALGQFLQDILEAIDRPLFFVIDGLDECDRRSRYQLLELLGVLSRKNSNLKILLSSRPEENILQQLRETVKIVMGSDAERDAIIVHKTVESNLGYLSQDVKRLIIDRLSREAQGSAIWTKMIVELIEKRRISGLNPMRRFLDEMPLPNCLSTLYDTILLRYASDDPENLKLARTALKILAVARRPLSVSELAWAATLGSIQQDVRSVADLAELVDHQRIMSIIRPFISNVACNNLNKRQLRLVHQSVKEFVMSTSASVGPNLQDTGTDLASDPGLDCQVTERVEAEMLRVCTRYLLLAEIGRQNLFSEEQTAIEQLPQEVDLFSNDEGPIEYNPYCSWEVWEETMIRYDPTERGFGEFFVYASCHWVDHFGAVASEPLPDLESIENICLAGSTRFQNWTEQNRRPDCVIRPRVEFDSSLYDALGITSLFGSERMLRHTLDHSDFSNGKFLSEPAMGAADQIFQWGDLSRLVILFNTSGELENQLQNLDFFRLAITRWSNSYTHPRDSPHWNLVFDLVNNVLDVMTVEKWGNELLCIAAGKGCVPVIQRLMNGARCNAGLRAELLRETRHKHHRVVFGKPVHQSIGEAILENHLDVVEYLLRQDGIEAHLQYRNHHGENVLHLASKTCNPEVFRLLVPRFEGGIHQADEQGNTPLSRAILSTAASQNRSESVGILLGATRGHPNSYFECEQHPLRIAVQLCDLNMCRLLITTGKFDPAVALRLDTNGSKVLRDEYFGDAQTASDILQLLCRYANSGSTSG